MKRHSLHTFFLAALVAASVLFVRQAAAVPNEYVIVSGGVSLEEWEKYKAQPHDGWWLNFIRAARIRIAQLQAQPDPDRTITWMVYAPAYRRRQVQGSQDIFGIIGSVRDAYGVKLIYFSRTDELVNYLNAGNSRDRVKLSGFEFFGHSNKACFMFDYSNEIDSASKVWLHENDLTKLRRGIFAKGAHVKSWGCHTGESMSMKWAKATGVPMIGAVGKTQYQTHDLPAHSRAGNRWTQ